MEGERTLYTVQCSEGQWSGRACTGRLMAARSYRYEARPGAHEVVFSVDAAPSQRRRLAPCEVRDARNWSCAAGNDSASSVTLTMVCGQATDPAPPALGLRVVPKLQWWRLKAGLDFSRDVEP